MQNSMREWGIPVTAMVLATLVLLLNACIAPPAGMTVQTDSGRVEGASAAEAQAASSLAAEERATMSSTQLSGILTGTVTYLQRIALPSGSVVEVQLQDVSRADAQAQIIASQTITTAGENVPIPFRLSYDPAQIDPRFTYALSARITINGELRWINTESYAVLTHDAPLTGVEVVVRPVP